MSEAKTRSGMFHDLSRGLERGEGDRHGEGSDHGCHRDIFRGVKGDEPDPESDENGNRHQGQEGATGSSNALAALKAQPECEIVPKDRGQGRENGGQRLLREKEAGGQHGGQGP